MYFANLAHGPLQHSPPPASGADLPQRPSGQPATQWYTACWFLETASYSQAKNTEKEQPSQEAPSSAYDDRSFKTLEDFSIYSFHRSSIQIDGMLVSSCVNSNQLPSDIAPGQEQGGSRHSMRSQSVRQLRVRSASAWRYLVSNTTIRMRKPKSSFNQVFLSPIFKSSKPPTFRPSPHTAFTYPPISFRFLFSWTLVNSKKKFLSAGKRRGCKRLFIQQPVRVTQTTQMECYVGQISKKNSYFLLIPCSLPFAIPSPYLSVCIYRSKIGIAAATAPCQVSRRSHTHPPKQSCLTTRLST